MLVPFSLIIDHRKGYLPTCSDRAVRCLTCKQRKSSGTIVLDQLVFVKDKQPTSRLKEELAHLGAFALFLIQST